MDQPPRRGRTALAATAVATVVLVGLVLAGAADGVWSIVGATLVGAALLAELVGWLRVLLRDGSRAAPTPQDQHAAG